MKSILEFNDGEVVVVASRPGEGKTLFMLNSALYYLLAYPERKVLYFSLDFHRFQIIRKMLRIIGKEANSEYIRKLLDNFLNFTLDDGLEDVENKMLKYLYSQDELISVVFIDYIQLITCKHSDLYNFIDEWSKRYSVPIVLATQYDPPAVLDEQYNLMAEEYNLMAKKYNLSGEKYIFKIRHNISNYRDLHKHCSRIIEVKFISEENTITIKENDFSRIYKCNIEKLSGKIEWENQIMPL